MTSGLIASAMLLGLISDFVAPAALFTSTTDLIFGYASILVSMISTCTSINRQTDSGEYSIWAGFPLLLLALFSSMLGLGGISGNVVALLVSVTAGISALTWSATQPRAVSTTLTLTWPLTMVCAGFLSLNILHDMTVLQAASGILLYIGVFQSVQSSGIASSSQTAANVLPSNKISKFGGYYINEILKDKESRDIFYFLLLNLSFMVVQMLYGIWTNSLGLISDSIHMFFDCLALAVGLVAAVMSKWPASRSHPFGFAKVEIISGFANGIFLVLISISIMIEAVERLLEPPEMKTDQLLLVSTLGLGVNLVGIFAFNHGHHHGHSHGHSHGHDLSHETKKTPEPLPTIHTPRTSRHDSSFDHVMGLQSPAPEFSGFDQDRRASLVGLGLGDGLGELKEHVLPLPNGHSGYRDRSPNRARSPVRRPGSPLKFAHEPLLPDVTEDHELVAYGDSGTDLLESHSHPHDHDHDQPHGSGKTCHKSSQGGSEGSHSHAMIQNTTGHARDHSPDHSHNHTHSHKKSDSYDLTAGHTHDHDSCSGHAHSEPHSRKNPFPIYAPRRLTGNRWTRPLSQYGRYILTHSRRHAWQRRRHRINHSYTLLWLDRLRSTGIDLHRSTNLPLCHSAAQVLIQRLIADIAKRPRVYLARGSRRSQSNQWGQWHSIHSFLGRRPAKDARDIDHSSWHRWRYRRGQAKGQKKTARRRP